MIIRLRSNLPVTFSSKMAELLAQQFERSDMYRSCLTCLNWGQKILVGDTIPSGPETCIKFQQRPPAYIIANGCDHYQDNGEIPF